MFFLPNKKYIEHKVTAHTFMRIGLILILMLFICSCSSIKVHANNSSAVHPYAGTKLAVKSFFDSFVSYDYYGQPSLMAIDVPLCFFADTLLLPYDLIIYLDF